MSRNRVWFTKTMGQYRAGKWYDGVSEDDMEFAVESGAAIECHWHPACGCLMAADRAVAVAVKGGHEPCPEHVADALVKPMNEKPKPMSLRDQQALTGG